jgi:hypothetical protein
MAARGTAPWQNARFGSLVPLESIAGARCGEFSKATPGEAELWFALKRGLSGIFQSPAQRNQREGRAN